MTEHEDQEFKKYVGKCTELAPLKLMLIEMIKCYEFDVSQIPTFEAIYKEKHKPKRKWEVWVKAPPLIFGHPKQIISYMVMAETISEAAEKAVKLSMRKGVEVYSATELIEGK